MKNFKFFIFSLLALTTIACTHESNNETLALKNFSENEIDQKTSNTKSATVSQQMSVSAEIFYDNLKTIAYATNALEQQPLISQSYDLVADNDSNTFINPIGLKLQNLTIENEETGKQISFFELSPEEKLVFLDKLFVEERSQLAEKLSAEPELIAVIERENAIVSNIIRKEGLTELKVINEEMSMLRGRSTISTNSYTNPVKVKIASASNLFNTINNELQKPSSANRGSVGVTFTKPTANPYNVRKMLVSNSRRGDFLLTLPIHGAPFVYLNLNSDFKVGHAGIIKEKVTNSTSIYENISIDATFKEGVTYKNIYYWATPCYVMGIQKVKWVWRWRGFRSGLYRQIIPVPNPGALADWAEKYREREYVKWYEFPVAKWAAPTRFTCTTLVWWCAKKAYGINVSSWYSPLVTPSGLLTDGNTYVRGQVWK